MILHQRTHAGLDVPGCFGCKIASVQLAPSATPSRRGGARAAQIEATDRSWARDMAAYKRLRQDGLQPMAIDGAHELETKARSVVEVETGLNSPPAVAYERYKNDLEYAT